MVLHKHRFTIIPLIRQPDHSPKMHFSFMLDPGIRLLFIMTSCFNIVLLFVFLDCHYL